MSEDISKERKRHDVEERNNTKTETVVDKLVKREEDWEEKLIGKLYHPGLSSQFDLEVGVHRWTCCQRLEEEAGCKIYECKRIHVGCMDFDFTKDSNVWTCCGQAVGTEGCKRLRDISGWSLQPAQSLCNEIILKQTKKNQKGCYQFVQGFLHTESTEVTRNLKNLPKWKWLRSDCKVKLTDTRKGTTKEISGARDVKNWWASRIKQAYFTCSSSHLETCVEITDASLCIVVHNYALEDKSFGGFIGKSHIRETFQLDRNYALREVYVTKM